MRLAVRLKPHPCKTRELAVRLEPHSFNKIEAQQHLYALRRCGVESAFFRSLLDGCQFECPGVHKMKIDKVANPIAWTAVSIFV